MRGFSASFIGGMMHRTLTRFCAHTTLGSGKFVDEKKKISITSSWPRVRSLHHCTDIRSKSPRPELRIMDRPTRAVSWLESFSPDVWSYFACYLPGEQLGRLRMTGATLLWQRLKSPKVVKSVTLGRDFINFKSYPRFLNDFPSLEELSILSHSDEWSQGLGLKIDLIPSGVRKLELHGHYWKHSADMLFGEDASLKLNEHLPHLEVLDVDGLQFASYSWMAHAPKSLTKLGLNRWDGTVELPSSLIHFEACTVDLSAHSFVSKLPPSLESFVLTTSLLRGIELLVPVLPPSIRNLDLSYRPEYSDGPISPQSLLAHLPKSLTSFSVPVSTETKFTAVPTLASLLPSTLTELDIAPHFPCSAWSYLPQKLTKLYLMAPNSICTMVSTVVDNQGVPHEVSYFPFDLLPRSITSLKLFEPTFAQSFGGPPAVTKNSYFPPQLTVLSISGIQLSPEVAKLLPASLTHLETGNICQRVCEHLPKGIVTLASRVLMSPNLIEFLPKSITSLAFVFPDAEDPWFDYNTGKRVEITALPDYSIHEKCTRNDFVWKGTRLPPNLRYFNAYNSQELGDSFLLHQQLHNLVDLKLAHAKHFSDLLIHVLPPYLRTLDLASSSKVSGKSFPLLPRGLTDLNLNSSKLIFDSDVQHLPRTLKSARLMLAKHLTDSCISDFPPHLEFLNMSLNAQVTPSAFPLFPYAIRSSRIAIQFANWRIYMGAVQQN